MRQRSSHTDLSRRTSIEPPLAMGDLMLGSDGFATWLEAGRESVVQKSALQHSQPMYRIALLEKITLRPSASVVLYLQSQTHACRLQQGNVQLLDMLAVSRADSRPCKEQHAW